MFQTLVFVVLIAVELDWICCWKPLTVLDKADKLELIFYICASIHCISAVVVEEVVVVVW